MTDIRTETTDPDHDLLALELSDRARQRKQIERLLQRDVRDQLSLLQTGIAGLFPVVSATGPKRPIFT